MVRTGNTIRPYAHSNPLDVADPKNRQGGHQTTVQASRAPILQAEKEKRRKARKQAKKARRG